MEIAVLHMWNDIAWGLPKLGIILENIVPSNLKFAKHDNENVFQIGKTIFETENELWKLKFHQFEVAGFMSINKIQQFS